MKYRKMGNLDFNVSALGFGAMRLPSKSNPFDPRVDETKSINVIRKGINLGINYIDTAWFYHFGASEKILGEALKDGYREKVFLVTKSPVILIKKTEDFDKYLNKQLERLQTEYLDAYLLHGLNEAGFNKVIELGLLDKMKEAKRKGIIKHIGFSFHDTLPVFKKIIDYYNWDLTQIQYNYLDTTTQATKEGLEYAYKKGIAVVVMEPLKGGKLANPPKEAIEILNKSEFKRTPVDWALQYLWNLKEVSLVISGMKTMKMVKENCESADNSGINTLSIEENEILASIVDIYNKNIVVPCTSCNYCMPCPFGVHIPKNFAIINTVGSKVHGGMDKYMKWKIKKSYKKLVSGREKIDLNNPNGNAAMCTNCGKCIPKCPQAINIPKELEMVHEVLHK